MGRRSQFIAIAAVIAMLLAGSAWAWAQIPPDAYVSMYWDIADTPDLNGDRFPGVLLPLCHL